MDILHWFLAFLPILVLFIALLRLHINAPAAGFIAMLTAGVLSYFIFGGSLFLLSVAAGKGLSLAFFVLLIIWSSLLIYNLMSELGLMRSIAAAISGLTVSRSGQALICGWAFAGFIEGIAGFGVPVAVITPIMVALGFNPLVSAVTVLVGHSWAVTFGGMAASYYTLLLVTGLPAGLIGTTMAALFCLPILATGFCVAHIQGGWPGLKQSAPVVIICGLIMSGCMWLSAFLKVPQIASITAGVGGCAAIWLLSKTPLFDKKENCIPLAEHRESGVNFHLAFMPYYIIVLFALISQVPVIKLASHNLYLAFSFPGVETVLGYVVPPVREYAKISLLGHPAPIILLAFLITISVFRWTRYWKKDAVVISLKATGRQCIQPSLAVLTIVVMALIMNDSGMTNTLATGIAWATGAAFPLFSPFIGVLGCFMTGSNANSNVMFAQLQMDAAARLGMSREIIASTQSIGGALGASIAPAKVLLGSSTGDLSGREGEIIRKTMVYCFIVTLLAGIQTFILVNI